MQHIAERDLHALRPEASADDGKRLARWTFHWSCLLCFYRGRGPGREIGARLHLAGTPADDGKRWSRGPFRCSYPSMERSDNDMPPGRVPQTHLADLSGFVLGAFFMFFFNVFLERFLVRFWSHFGSLLASFFHVFFMLKIDVFFDAFWEAF